MRYAGGANAFCWWLEIILELLCCETLIWNSKRRHLESFVSALAFVLVLAFVLASTAAAATVWLAGRRETDSSWAGRRQGVSGRGLSVGAGWWRAGPPPPNFLNLSFYNFLLFIFFWIYNIIIFGRRWPPTADRRSFIIIALRPVYSVELKETCIGFYTDGRRRICETACRYSVAYRIICSDTLYKEPTGQRVESGII